MSKKWIIFISIIVLWIIGGIGLLIQVYQNTLEAERLLEVIKIAFLIIGGLGIVLPTYLNVWQSLENNKVVEERLKYDKLENSFQILEKWDDTALLTARRFTREIKDHRNDITNNELLKRINEEKGLKESVIMVFNYFEKIRISIESKRVDEVTIKEALHPVFIDMYERFKPWIDMESNIKDDVKKLYDRWKKT